MTCTYTDRHESEKQEIHLTHDNKNTLRKKHRKKK